MKCVKCGSCDDLKTVNDSPIRIAIQCGICGRAYSLTKMSVGKKHELFFYLDLLRVKIRENEYLIAEARGDLIPKMLVIVCNVVDKDKLVQIESVDVLCRKDAKNKEVATERVLLRKLPLKR